MTKTLEISLVFFGPSQASRFSSFPSRGGASLPQDVAGGEEAGEEVEGDDGGPQEAGRAEEGILRAHSENRP